VIVTYYFVMAAGIAWVKREGATGAEVWTMGLPAQGDAAFFTASLGEAGEACPVCVQSLPRQLEERL
jgi:hypothetical protein